MKKIPFGFLLSLPGIIFLALLVVYPFSMLIGISFLRYDLINPIRLIGLNNYLKIFTDRLFWLSLKNTIIYSGGVTALTTIVAILLAASIARIKKLSTFLRTLLILPWAVPLVVSGLVWRWMLDPGVGVYNYMFVLLGLTDKPINLFGDPTLAMLACILADSWTKIPFMFVLVLAAIKSIPPELYEAARIDGATMIDTFRYITIPLCKKSILSGILITGMFSFRTIDAIWSMTRGGPAKATYVLGYYLIDYLVNYTNLGVGCAVGVTMFVLIFLFAGILIYLILKEE